MALTTVSSDRLATNVKNTNFTAAEKQDLTDDILPLAGQLGNRNLIINGAMQVAQYGQSYTGGGYATVDRFFIDYAGLDEAPTQAQVDVASGTSPYTSGFRKAWKITNGNQTSGAGAADLFYITQVIEAQNIAQSGWNYTSSSSNITLSFWIKSSVAQTFKGHLRADDGTQQIYHFETGSLTADTWTKITKTIPGNSNVQFDNNNAAGLRLVIVPFAGTNFTAVDAQENAWQAYNSNIFGGKDNTSTWYTTNDATLEITGVQLEVGSVATDFEHRTFGQDLDLCMRYFQKIPSDGNLMGQVGRVNGTTVSDTNFNLTKVMRAQPSVTLDSSGGFAFEYGSNGVGVSSASVSGISAENVFMRFNLSGSATNGHATYMQLSAGSFMKCSAELT